MPRESRRWYITSVITSATAFTIIAETFSHIFCIANVLRRAIHFNLERKHEKREPPAYGILKSKASSLGLDLYFLALLSWLEIILMANAAYCFYFYLYRGETYSFYFSFYLHRQSAIVLPPRREEGRKLMMQMLRDLLQCGREQRFLRNKRGDAEQDKHSRRQKHNAN